MKKLVLFALKKFRTLRSVRTKSVGSHILGNEIESSQNPSHYIHNSFCCGISENGFQMVRHYQTKFYLEVFY